MELIKLNYKKYIKNKIPIVATIGQFDGLHVAHLELIKKTMEIAKEKNYKSAVITFDPHPDFVLKKDLRNTYVTPLEEKIFILEHLGIDYMILINFDMNVANIDPTYFLEKYLISNNIKDVVVGFDFAFGKYGNGKAKDINRLSNGLINTTIIEEIKFQDVKIGTSFIKELLEEGKVNIVNQLLGRNYKITGKVVKGKQIGRTINLPTANFEVDEQFASICPGVYVVKIFIDNEQYFGFANLGINPSFNQSTKMVFETHIFDFFDDIYDKIIDVELLDFIRHEIKFKNTKSFLSQIERDKKYAIQFCKTLNNAK